MCLQKMRNVMQTFTVVFCDLTDPQVQDQDDCHDRLLCHFDVTDYMPFWCDRLLCHFDVTLLCHFGMILLCYFGDRLLFHFGVTAY